MRLKPLILFIFLVCSGSFVYARQVVPWHVYDATSKAPLPFATVKFGETGQGVVAEMDGSFSMPAGNIRYIEVSSLGYQPKKITLPAATADIYLQPLDNTLNEVKIAPPYEKMRRILNNAIANKYRNDPDKYDWYRCHVYYKMTVDADKPTRKTYIIPDKKKMFGLIAKKETPNVDTAKEKALKELLENQHLLMSETYSIRTWEQPQHLQEDVLASRFSGFKKSMFTGLVTDVLPFHAYTDYINLNGKDYHNPVSKGFDEYYKFNLVDEIMQGNDTVWVLSFRPRRQSANDLKGTVYINSSGYAISQVIARAKDTMRKMDVRIEQQYEQIAFGDSEKRWFPKHLNYVIDWEQEAKKGVYNFHLQGHSRIDSVTWDKEEDFHFDKTHTVKLQTKADELSDSTWKTIRPEPLDLKETATYRYMDSLGEKAHLDRWATYWSKLPEGKVPVGVFDFDLKRLVTLNNYEQYRLGMGVQTNEHLIKWLSVGGWGGYGISDAHWKYGAFAEFYGDRYREFVFKLSYDNDINDPGRIRMGNELDKNYLNGYLLQRVDNTKTYAASVKKKLGYWTLELAGRQQQINPLYRYALLYDATAHTTFTANEGSLTLRYAYAERTAPFFGYYYSTGSRYPIWYGKITAGSLASGTDMQIPYLQAVTAAVYHKHINRIGFEHMMVEGGKIWSNGTLPLSKLFAGNGYNYDGKSLWSFYTFGGIMTMLPYQFYTDQFVSIIYRHDFDWKLYKIEIPDTKFSSAPNICLQYDMLYGTLNHPELQQYVNFSVPNTAYQEVGILLNSLARVRYANLYYITLNVGYFYHFTPVFSISSNSKAVVGIGFEF